MRRHYSFDPVVEIVSHLPDNDAIKAADVAKEADRDDDRTLAFSALGLLAVAVATGGIAAARRYHHIKKHKE